MTDGPIDERPRIEPEPPHRELERPSIPPRILALVALAVVLIVIAIGAGFARERIARAIGPAPPVSEGQERVQMRQRIEQLESELDLARRQAGARPEPVVVPTEDGEAVVVDPLQLEDRMAALEASQARMSRAAAAAVAAASLADAAEGSEPFAGEDGVGAVTLQIADAAQAEDRAEGPAQGVEEAAVSVLALGRAGRAGRGGGELPHQGGAGRGAQFGKVPQGANAA